MERLQIGKATLTWLNGGVNHLDGGAVFGIIPKEKWSKEVPFSKDNLIEFRTDPILIQIEGNNYLIDSGMGNGKLTNKQVSNFGVLEESSVESSLAELGLIPNDINKVLMTHLHFDHACGLTKVEDGNYFSFFKNADIFVSQTEWNEMRNPNIRSVNTYWKKNWMPIKEQVIPFEKEIIIADNLKMIHTGGHSDGHSIIVFEDNNESFIHMGDVFPTHAHQNKLWQLSYDDYPLKSIEEKDKWLNYGYNKGAWFTFYHDAYYRAIKFDEVGKNIAELKRLRYDYL